MKHSVTVNSLLLLWLAAGCIAVAIARDENSSLKKFLCDINAPGMKIISDSHQLIEKRGLLSFLNTSDSNADLVDEKKSSEVVKLQRENLALKQLLAQRSNTEKSNQSTSRLFGPKLISAQILLPDQQQRWKSGMLLDAGASDKIREQDWIVSDDLPLIDLGEDFGIKPDEILLSGRVVVGQIHAVGRWTSSYRAVTDSEFRCPATIIKSRDSQHTIERNDQQVQTVGSLHGTDQEICELRYIENTFPVRVGDLVVLADEQQRFEGSLVLGTITEARVLSNSPFWKIQVRPVKRTVTTRDVLVITEELNPLRLLTN